MKDIDAKIREALRKEDSELLGHYREEPAIYEMVVETFRGRFRWVNLLALVMSILVTAMMVVVAYEFFQVETTRAMIGCAAGFVWGAVFIAMIKTWFWLEMNKNSVTREVKRLELQLANLSRRLADAERRG